MKKRNVIEKDAVIIFDRVVKASELNSLPKDFCGDIVITKKLIMDRKLDISCNLYITGDIVRKYPISEHTININGDLYCYGEVHCSNINVSGCFYSDKVIYSKNIRVGENFLFNDKVDAYGYQIIVAGDIEGYDIIAKRMEYRGTIKVYGTISLASGIIDYRES